MKVYSGCAQREPASYLVDLLSRRPVAASHESDAREFLRQRLRPPLPSCRAPDAAWYRTRRRPVPVHRPIAQHRVPVVHDPAARNLHPREDHEFYSRMYVSGLRGVSTIGDRCALVCVNASTRGCLVLQRSGVHPRRAQLADAYNVNCMRDNRFDLRHPARAGASS
jgi:hypothetical protein